MTDNSAQQISINDLLIIQTGTFIAGAYGKLKEIKDKGKISPEVMEEINNALDEVFGDKESFTGALRSLASSPDDIARVESIIRNLRMPLPQAING